MKSTECTCQGCDAELPPQTGRGRTRVWCSDRCRKRTLYSRPCMDCGKALNGSDGIGPNAPKRCVQCHSRAHTIWTADAIVTAIQAWVRENGVPPSASDWNPALAIALGHPYRAEKFYDDDAWPHVSTVQARFGYWNEAIRAAGFEPNQSGRYGRPGEDMELCQEIRERYETGESSTDLAARYGCRPKTIRYRIEKAGGQMRTQAAAQSLRWQRVAA